MIPKDIHLRIRAVRRELDLTQEFIAKKLGVDQQAISQIELGTKSVDEDLLDRIAQILGVSREYIITKEYVQPIQINNNNCSGNVGYNNVTVNSDKEIIEELKDIFERMQSNSLKAFEEMVSKLLDTLKKKGD